MQVVLQQARASLRKENDWNFTNGRVYLRYDSVAWEPQNLAFPVRHPSMTIPFGEIRKARVGPPELRSLFQRPLILETAHATWRLYFGNPLSTESKKHWVSEIESEGGQHTALC
jgi:hypothetical protein